MDTVVAADAHWLVTQQSYLTISPNKSRENNWTPVNPPGKIASTLTSPPLPSRHDGVELESPQASKFRSTILASAELLKWLAGPRKRRKSPSQSPTHRRKRVRVAATPFQIPGRIVKSSESEIPPLKPTCAKFTSPDETVSQSDQVLLPWNSNEQNANIGKKRTFTNAFPRGATKSPIVRPDETGGQGRIKPVNQHATNLKEPDENSEDFFLDNPEDMEDFLEVEKSLTAIVAQATTTEPPRRPTIDRKAQTQGKGSPMKPFMRQNFQLRPPAKTTEAAALVGLSAFNRTPTCFRIAEALRLLNAANPSHGIAFELFGVLRPSSWIFTDVAAMPAIEIADLFFPHLPPSLRLDIESSQVKFLRDQLSTTTSQSLQGTNSDTNGQTSRNMIRALIKARPVTTGLSSSNPRSIGDAVRDKFEIKVLHARPTTWEVVKVTLELLEASHNAAGDFAHKL
jgi:hypothetical protein